MSYDYDLRGLTLSSRFGNDAGPGITNTFDGFGRLTAATTNMGGTSRTLNYRYDPNGNRTRITHPDNWFFQYDFDGVNRMDSLSESTAASASAGVTSVLTIDYQSGGGRWHIYRPSGATTTYTQDNIKRLESFTQDFASTANDLTNSFQYNPASQITFLARSNSLYTITGQVSRTGTYVPNGLNQYTSIANQSITYDGNGNLTSDGSLNYVYDMENHLVATTGSAATTMVYDPLGRLFQVSVPGKTIQLLYDGDAIVAEYNASTGALISRFAHGDQVDEPLVQYSGASLGSSARSYLHADHQGSIIAQSSSSGAIKARLAYDPYGIPASGNALRFGYTGQMYLSTLGLNYYKARWYSPKLGRFLQTDPIFYADDMNMYAYVGNDPVGKADPTGMAPPGCGDGSCRSKLSIMATVAGSVSTVLKGGELASATTASGASELAASASTGRGASALGAMVVAEKGASILGKASDIATAVRAGAQFADGDRRGAAITVTGEMINKGIGYAAGMLTAPLGPQVSIPVAVGTDAVSGALNIGPALAGPTLDGVAQGIADGIENGNQQGANVSHEIEATINRGQCLGLPDATPRC